MMLWVLVVLVATVLLPMAACRTDLPPDTAPSAAATQAPATPVDEAARTEVLGRFLSQPIRGERPFPTVNHYLSWLQHRPGAAAATADAVPEGAGTWRIVITLQADDGRTRTPHFAQPASVMQN